MTMSDPIADMLTRIRNASLARHLALELAFGTFDADGAFAEVDRHTGGHRNWHFADT